MNGFWRCGCGGWPQKPDDACRAAMIRDLYNRYASGSDAASSNLTLDYFSAMKFPLCRVLKGRKLHQPKVMLPWGACGFSASWARRSDARH